MSKVGRALMELVMEVRYCGEPGFVENLVFSVDATFWFLMAVGKPDPVVAQPVGDFAG